MRIEDFKRWHWCVIGLLLGAVVASVSLFAGPSEPRGTETDGPHAFEAQLLTRKDASRRHVYRVTDVRFHPATDTVLPSDVGGMAEFITYTAWLVREDNPRKADPFPRRMLLHLYNPRKKSVVGDPTKMSMRDYLAKLRAHIDGLNKANPGAALTFDYRFRWIETPAGAFTVYPAAGLLVIGLIWPSLVGLLIGAGFGRARDEDEFDLSKYNGGREPGKKRPAVTHADAAELARLEAELEAKLRSGEVGVTTASDDAKAIAAAPPAPRPLDAGPLEQPKAPAKPAAVKGYGADQGDYYPTEVHGKPKR